MKDVDTLTNPKNNNSIIRISILRQFEKRVSLLKNCQFENCIYAAIGNRVLTLFHELITDEMQESVFWLASSVELKLTPFGGSTSDC